MSDKKYTKMDFNDQCLKYGYDAMSAKLLIEEYERGSLNEDNLTDKAKLVLAKYREQCKINSNISENKEDAVSSSVPKQLLNQEKTSESLNKVNIMISEKSRKSSIIEAFPITEGKHCQNYSTEYFPPKWQIYLKSLYDSCTSHEVIIANAFLTAYKSFIKGRVFHFISPGNPIFPRSWYLTIAGSGRRKSTGMDLGMRIALKVEDEIREEINRLDSSCFNDDDKYKNKKDEKLKKSLILNNSGSFAGLEDCIHDTLGGAIYIDEHRQWNEFLAQQCNSGAKAQMTKMHNCPAVYKGQTRKNGKFYLFHPVVSLNSITTHAWFAELQNSSDWISGFGYRYDYFILPDDNIKEPTFVDDECKIDLEIEKDIFKELNALRAKYPITNTTPLDNKNRKELKRSKQATQDCKELDQYLFDYFKKIDSEKFLETARRRIISKVLSDAMVFQIGFNPNSTEIESRAIWAAYSHLKHSIDSLIFIFKENIDNSSKALIRINAFLNWANEFKEKNNKPPTRAEALKNCRATRTKFLLDMVLDTVVDANRIEVIKGKTKSEDQYNPK